MAIWNYIFFVFGFLMFAYIAVAFYDRWKWKKGNYTSHEALDNFNKTRHP